MLGRRLSTVILIGTGLLIVSSANGDITQNTSNIDPAILVGIGDPLCLKSPGNAADNRLFYKIAAASKNELQPYGQFAKGGAAITACRRTVAVEQPWHTVV